MTREDGTTETIYIGDGADSDYYMTTGDKENVYTVSSSLPNVLEMNTDNLKEEEETESTEDDASADDSSSDDSTSGEESTDTESGSTDE